jgi:hypothetical protein
MVMVIDATFTVPETATVWLVAPVLATVTLPELAPGAAFDLRRT